MTKHTHRRPLFSAALALGLATVGLSTTAAAAPCDEPTGYVVAPAPAVVPVAYSDSYADPYTVARPIRTQYGFGRTKLVGSLTGQEYQLLAQVGGELDRNRDGRLSTAERRNFETLVIAMRTFDRADTNDSRRLSPEEAGRSRFFAARFAILDRDHDGHVYEQEMLRAVLVSLRRGDHYFEPVRTMRSDLRDHRTAWFDAGVSGGVRLSAY
jgi:hypothetical protein